MNKRAMSTEEIIRFVIEKIDLNSKDMNAIVITVLIGVFLFQGYKSINNAYIEELFMKRKEREINIWSKCIFLTLLLLAENMILIVENSSLIIELIFSAIGIVGYFVYDRLVTKTERYIQKLSELNSHYKEIRQIFFWIMIISITPFCISLLCAVRSDISIYICVLFASIIETFLICLSMPDMIKRNSSLYFIEGSNRIYIYKKLDAQTILCGDNPQMNKTKKYMFVNYDKLKDKEIYNVQYRALSEARKKELKDTYKELKTKENTKLLIDCIKFKLHINKKDK